MSGKKQMNQYNPSEKSRVRRSPKGAKYDKKTIFNILDDNLVAHVAFSDNGQPVVIPMLYGRINDHLYLHGASSGRLVRILTSGTNISISVAKVDGLVLARSAFHHSLNYRSVVLFGKASLIEDPELKIKALKAISDHMMPGRWDEVRLPNEKELKATGIMQIIIEEASAKIRTGGPIDEPEDYNLAVWAGVLPIERKYGEPIPDDRMTDDLPIPKNIGLFVK